MPDARRVLIVDDNRDAAELLALMLMNLGFACRSAFDGPAALTMAEEFQPNAILLDLGMPGMNGLEVARRLRADKRFQNLLLIALTGWDKEEDRRETRDAGFDHHLAKPVAVDTLLEMLGSIGRGAASAGDGRPDGAPAALPGSAAHWP
jgi:CheY-like chemotaxis protein